MSKAGVGERKNGVSAITEVKKRRQRVKLTVLTVCNIADRSALESVAKACTKCGVIKEIAHFHVQVKGIGGRRSWCQACAAINDRARYEKSYRGDVKRLAQWTEVTYREEVRIRTNGEYVFTGEYVNTKHPSLHFHTICGKNWSIRPNDFLSGKRCSSCFGNTKKSTEKYKSEVFEKVGPEYSALEEYVNADFPILHRHEICRHEWLIRPNSFLRGDRCPSCYGNAKKTTEIYKAEVFEKTGTEYSVMGDYQSKRIPIKHRHETCRHEWPARPDDFLSGSRCPRCAESKGERRVSEVLTKYNVSYRTQEKYADCRAIKPLPFDRAIITDSKVTALIEYDGEQHFIARPFFGGESGLAERQRNDAIKTEYCRVNSIPLLRIKYTEFKNIEAILVRELTEIGVSMTLQALDSAA